MIDSEKLKELAEQQRRDYYKQYREENRERLKEYQKQWRLNNPGKTEQYRDSYWKKKALAAIEAKQRGKYDHGAESTGRSPQINNKRGGQDGNR